MQTRFWLKQRRRKSLSSVKIKTDAVPGLVSVVLPVYNGEAYLEEAIDSVLCQSRTNWELWIIDDGSTDRSGEIAEGYAKKDPRISVIHQENLKLPRALNRGFQSARGEFYTWMSADNRMLPDFIACMAGELEQSPETDMVFANQYLIDEKGDRILGHSWFELPPGSGRVCFPEITPLFNKIPNNTVGAAFMYRAGAEAVLGGYSENLFLLEDYDYFMRMNSLFKIRHVSQKEPVYEYRFHPGSLTARDEELGITAGRPRLMEWDAYRRKRYLKPVSAVFFGFPPEMERMLYRNGFQNGSGPALYWGESGKNDSDFYKIQPVTEVFAVWYREERIALLETEKELTEFLRLRILCDTLRREENFFFRQRQAPEKLSSCPL